MKNPSRPEDWGFRLNSLIIKIMQLQLTDCLIQEK
jgi:hypothetical protein